MFPRWLPITLVGFVLGCLIAPQPGLSAERAPTLVERAATPAEQPTGAPKPTAAMTITAGTVTTLNVGADIRTVVVAVPEIADATVTAPRRMFLLGRKLGRTGLTVIGTDGAPLLETTVMVVPSDIGVITVDRGMKQTTLNCSPRCTEAESGKASQDGASASPSGGAGATGAR